MYKVRIADRNRSAITMPPPMNTDKIIGNSKIRHMDHADIPNVEELLKAFGLGLAQLMYGNFDIEFLWSRSYISILLEDGDDVVATMMLNNYPNVPSIPIFAWEHWLHRNYEIKFLSPDNTLWVHLFLFKTEIKTDVTEAFLKFIFKKYLHVKFVVFVVPPHLPQFHWLSRYGTVLGSPIMQRPRLTQRLLLLRRSNFISCYTTRRAVVGDNDDIVALLDRTCPKMKQLYGKHYIASIIADNDCTRQIIVAEYNGIIVAAMILNSQVNYDMLNVCFKLEMLHGLRKVPVTSPSFVEESDGLECQIGKNKSLSEFTLRTIPSGFLSREVKALKSDECQEEDVISEGGMSDIDFLLDLDDQSVESFDAEIPLHDEKSNESLFIGHLELNMSCVVLSYTYDQIQKFKQERKTCIPKYTNQANKCQLELVGEPNAFCIEAIAVSKQHAFAVNLLFLSSYEFFPEYDYCLLSLPCNEPTPPILKKFIRAHTKRDVTIPHELYICHKLSVLGKFSTREAYWTDENDILELIGPEEDSVIIEMFSRSIWNAHTSLRTYVFLCGLDIIGFAILDEEYDADYIKSHFYCREGFADIRAGTMDYGQIVYFIILPIFEKKSTFFLQELHRLSDYSKLLYSLSPKPHFVSGVIADMTLALPIEIGELKFNKNSYWQYPEVLSECKSVSALFVSTPSLCSRPKFELNTRIVVIGASDVGLSFVIALLIHSNTGKQVIYNNITIVSAHGVNRSNTTRILPITSNINKWTLDMHGLHVYVDIVEGVMTGINRKEKTITVSNNTICYDVLILTCGVQYQMPKRMPEVRKKRTENPENVFVINTEIDASLCLERLKKIWSSKQSNVIVYGHCLSAYCCLATLLHMGLPEKFLIFVDYVPSRDLPPVSDTQIFTDSTIESAILNWMKKRGVRLYRGFMYNWDYDEYERIKSVTFECATRRVTLECLAFFAYENKNICQTTLTAIKSAGLVFDGSLVITPDFRTNDPSIFAAGTCTKYPACYFAKYKEHKYFNQAEIGRKLAMVISDLVLNTHTSEITESSNKYFIPEYVEPLYVSCILPGEFNYFCVKNPGLMSHVGLFSDGEVLSTGKANDLKSQGYCRLHINGYGVIDEITCLTKEPIDVVNLTNIWGKHNFLFKKLWTRYKVGQITDFLEFFSGDEFTAIYNYMFPHLWDDLTLVLSSKPSKDGKDLVKPACLIDDIIQIFKINNGQKFKQKHFKLIKALFKGSVYEEDIVKMVLNFLEEFRTILPMYTHPLTIPILLSGFKDSDFFWERE